MPLVPSRLLPHALAAGISIDFVVNIQRLVPHKSFFLANSASLHGLLAGLERNLVLQTAFGVSSNLGMRCWARLPLPPVFSSVYNIRISSHVSLYVFRTCYWFH